MLSEFGPLSVVPPLLAIVLTIATRKAVLSLFIGIWAGAVIFTGSLGIGQTFEWIVAAVADDFPITVLPALVLVLAAFIAFSTGTSWGTMGILTPIVIPVAWNPTGDHTIIAAMVGVIFSGAIFGDHSSPISDTTVLSSTFTGADLIDHVRTQLYYALTVAVVAVALLLVWGVTRINPILLLPVGVVLLVGIVYGLSEFDANRKGVEPVVADAPQETQEPADD